MTASRSLGRRLAWTVVAIVAVLGLAGLVIWAPWANDVPATRAPTAVHARSPTATSILVQWGPSPGGPLVDHYLILRDGAEVGSVVSNKTSYVDRGLAPGTAHRYTIIAVAGKARSAPSAATAVRTLAPRPTKLRAYRSTVSSVAFRWSRPTKSPVPDRYVIVRGARTVGTVPGRTRAYKDKRLAPATKYRYRVMAAWGDKRSAPSPALVAKTLSPPLSAARLIGPASVRIKVTSTGGASVAAGESWTETWNLRRRCAHGTCTVIMSGAVAPPGYSYHSFTMTLTGNGVEYAGTATAHVTHCGSSERVDVMNTVSLRIRLTKAAARGRTWVATSWVGTLVVGTPYTSVPNSSLYCPAQSVTASLTGRRAD